MYSFKVITLFSELFEKFVQTSLIGKAVAAGTLSFSFIDLRDYTHDRHRTVDDTPYGGGSGMVMKTEPIIEALAAQPDTYRILMTPQGKPFKQEDARRLAALDKPLLLFCGRYEGVDERVRDMFDEQISIGDFVLNGGEIGAMAVIEAISRLLPGVLGNSESTVEESHTFGLPEYPQYTRPEEINGERVPAILLSGNHRKVAEWRHGQALLRTMNKRPDLFERYTMTDAEKRLLEEALKESSSS